MWQTWFWAGRLRSYESMGWAVENRLAEIVLDKGDFNYHWPMYGMALPDDILKKIYHDSALSAFRQAQSKARG